ncbi:hypothetical protein [Paracoccus sp. PAR01]|uniref:hypothetical protein n=1 Tax=Paracoccus sp. PAR01 TaxID=2769282 RepID=UPI00177F56B2|nr:hypothetical protein [Paracoccus sp. PAR01]MBD9528964.1 hypothetical protein [Paracoccus sp. PAR01]
MATELTTNEENEFIAKRIYAAHAKLEPDSTGIVTPWDKISDDERRQWIAAAAEAREILIPVRISS